MLNFIAVTVFFSSILASALFHLLYLLISFLAFL